ncbi:MAG: UPF0147 family protein [Candidatus Hodarchaeota archaeon]
MNEDNNYEKGLAKIDQAKQLLAEIAKNTQIPKNIRRTASEAFRSLDPMADDETPAVLANRGISILDEISQVLNCPPYARKLVWEAVIILETVKDEEFG